MIASTSAISGAAVGAAVSAAGFTASAAKAGFANRPSAQAAALSNKACFFMIIPNPARTEEEGPVGSLR
jgi:hypothetical protein